MSKLWFDERDLHMHHIEKRSKLGDDDLDNLITLCATCHQRQHRSRTRYICQFLLTAMVRTTFQALQGSNLNLRFQSIEARWEVKTPNQRRWPVNCNGCSNTLLPHVC
jgi:hypothetical protein